MFFYNFNYLIFMIPVFLLMWIVQAYVNGAYKKWRKIQNRRNITGVEAVDRMTRLAGLNDVQTNYDLGQRGLRVEQIGGQLTDRWRFLTRFRR